MTKSYLREINIIEHIKKIHLALQKRHAAQLYGKQAWAHLKITARKTCQY